jgi:hypothetical protein
MGVYRGIYLVFILAFRHALNTSNSRKRATIATVRISHRSQPLKVSQEEKCVSLLMILFTTVIL